MRLSKRKRTTLVAMNMTPMIDIVFLLIIFFMTVTQVSEMNKKQLELPKLKGSVDQKRSTLIVNVDEAGGIEVAGQPRTMVDIVTLVGNELAAVGDDPRRLTVVIRADRRGRSRTVNELVTRLGQLGLQQVRIAVQTGR